MVYYGNGGFTFSDLYTMPVYLRNFYLRKMSDIKAKEREEQTKSTGESPNSKKIHRPAVTRENKK